MGLITWSWAYAVAYHGAPRFTGDPDLLVRPTKRQIERVPGALRDFGFPTQEITSDDLLERRTILQSGHVPVQIHILTGISGVRWEEAWASRQPGAYGGVAVFFIGREALIANKRAAGRAVAELALFLPRHRQAFEFNNSHSCSSPGVSAAASTRACRATPA